MSPKLGRCGCLTCTCAPSRASSAAAAAAASPRPSETSTQGDISTNPAGSGSSLSYQPSDREQQQQVSSVCKLQYIHTYYVLCCAELVWVIKSHRRGHSGAHAHTLNRRLWALSTLHCTALHCTALDRRRRRRRRRRRTTHPNLASARTAETARAPPAESPAR